VQDDRRRQPVRAIVQKSQKHREGEKRERVGGDILRQERTQPHLCGVQRRGNQQEGQHAPCHVAGQLPKVPPQVGRRGTHANPQQHHREDHRGQGGCLAAHEHEYGEPRVLRRPGYAEVGPGKHHRHQQDRTDAPGQHAAQERHLPALPLPHPFEPPLQQQPVEELLGDRRGHYCRQRAHDQQHRAGPAVVDELGNRVLRLGLVHVVHGRPAGRLGAQQTLGREEHPGLQAQKDQKHDQQVEQPPGHGAPRLAGQDRRPPVSPLRQHQPHRQPGQGQRAHQKENPFEFALGCEERHGGARGSGGMVGARLSSDRGRVSTATPRGRHATGLAKPRAARIRAPCPRPPWLRSRP